MKKICIVYDEDTLYAKKFANALNIAANLRFEVQLFTEKVELLKYLKENKAEVIVISETSYFEDIKNEHADRVVVLTEEEQERKPTVVCDADIVRIYKYQSFEKIFKRITECSSLVRKKGLMNSEIIGIYSPVCTVARSSFVLNMAKVLAQKYKVIYLNLEEFSGLSELLPGGSNGNLSDALYYYRQGDSQAVSRIAEIIRSISGVDYIPAAKCAEDIADTDPEELMQFVETVGRYNAYEIIILDISSAITQSWKLLELCDCVYMPVREDYLCTQKIKAFEMYFIEIGMEHILDNIFKVKLPEGECDADSSFWENESIGGMYRFVEKLVENRF